MLAYKKNNLINYDMFTDAILQAFIKLNPQTLIKNPIVFIIEIIAIFCTLNIIFNTASFINAYSIEVTCWLWFTVLFANFAESLAENRAKAIADSLRGKKKTMKAKRIKSLKRKKKYKVILATKLKAGNLVLVEEGDIVPGDGRVLDGIATIDESAITGESAPVIRENSNNRNIVTGGTKVLSDWIIIEILAGQGESFLDKIISLVEGAKRQKTPNEIALNILLIGMSIIYLFVTISLAIFAYFAGIKLTIISLCALFIALIPSTIGGLLSAIGIAGIERMVKLNIIAKSGRAVEASGDIDVLLLDKTGTITIGNRMAAEFIPLNGTSDQELAQAAFYFSLSDDTAEGKSIIELAQKQFNLSAKNIKTASMKFINFSARTRISGVDFDDNIVRKGAVDAIFELVGKDEKQRTENDVLKAVKNISIHGGTALGVAKNNKILGVIYLKDTIKPDLKDRFNDLRKMGIKTIMVTGDNTLTASVIAAESGVDDFLATATPEKKLELIRKYQAEGKLVAMCGDGANDAPALAQADIGIAMNAGTQEAHQAANMIDLDNDPTKLIDVIKIGKELLISRGALATFSFASDAAKYFAIIPALFAPKFPQLQFFNIMKLSSPEHAILSTIIFNALIVIALIPLALKGVGYRPIGAKKILSRNLKIFGIGGLITPFIFIKIIDMVIK